MPTYKVAQAVSGTTHGKIVIQCGIASGVIAKSIIHDLRVGETTR